MRLLPPPLVDVPTEEKTDIRATPFLPTATAPVFVSTPPPTLYTPVTDLPALPESPDLMTLLHEPFDSLTTFRWANIRLPLAPLEDGYALSVANSTDHFALGQGEFSDVTIEARFKLLTGQAYLGARYSTAGSYAVSFDVNGTVQLLRNQNLVTTGIASVPFYDQWRNVRLETIGDRVRAYVDNTLVIEYVDASPILSGTLFLAASNATFFADDVIVQIPEGDLAQRAVLQTAEDLALETNAGVLDFQIAPQSLSSDFPIVFQSGMGGAPLNDYKLWLTNVNGSTFGGLTSGAGGRDPAWSPDGNKIAFSSNRDGNWEIYTMDATGANVQRLTFTSARDQFPVWSPNGTSIAFSSDRDHLLSGELEIYTMNSSGGNILRVSPTGTNIYSWIEDWSPDGTKLLFSRFYATTGEQQLYDMNTNGSNTRSLTAFTSASWYGTPSCPSWSPNGTKIAFAVQLKNFAPGYVAGHFDRLAIMDAVGTNIVVFPVVPNSQLETCPEWSPDGNQLVFQARIQTGQTSRYDLYRVNVVGVPQFTAITSAAQITSEQPDWSEVIVVSTPTPTPGFCLSGALGAGGTVSPNSPTCQIPQTCVVNIRPSDALRGPVYGYIFNGTGNLLPTLDISGRTNVTVNLRLRLAANPVPQSNLVRATDSVSGLDFWFNSGDGNVLNVVAGNCDSLVADAAVAATLKQNAIAVAATYGVNIDDVAGFTALIAPPAIPQYAINLNNATGANTTTVIDWEAEEVFNLMVGVIDIAKAFKTALDDPLLQRTPIAPEQAFLRGMGIVASGTNLARFNIHFIRVNNRIDCVNALIDSPRAIVCGNIDKGFSNFLTVHELGHTFDNQVAQGGQLSFNEEINLVSVNDTPVAANPTVAPRWVFGIYPPGFTCATGSLQGNNWSRGVRGWGTGPGSVYTLGIHELCQAPSARIFTNFQKNPPPYVANSGLTALQVAQQETVADMFLNWVYRIQNRDGFRNINWRPNDIVPNSSPQQYCGSPSGSGCPDNTNPGDARFAWIKTFMTSTLTRLIP